MKTNVSDKRHYYPALRGVFGDWIYYTCLMPAKEVAQRINFADKIHPNKGLSTLIQRRLKTGRSTEIGDYLIREKQRFFNSMVVAVYDGDPVWHGFSNFTPQVEDIKLKDIPEEAEDSVGFLSFSGSEKIFALDGQHRLAGIINAIERHSDVESDDVSLIVVAHQNTKAGLERTRRLFTTLNKTARPVGKGDIIALDENDVMAIVARQLVDFDPKFSGQRIKFAQTDNVSATDRELTTIGNLYDVLSTLFVKYPRPRSKQDLRFIRPADSELQEYVETAQTFFTILSRRFPELRSFFRTSEQRAGDVVATHRTATGGHILFRPIGLRIFAELTATLASQGRTLEDAVSALVNLPTDLNDAPYRGVIWRNERIVANGRVLARDLLLYMLRLKPDNSSLRQRYARYLDVTEDKVRMPSQIPLASR